MYKRTKETIQLILLIILIVTIPLIFISFEIIESFRAVSNLDPNSIIESPLEKIYNEITTTSKNNDASIVRKHIFEIFKLMNQKDFNKLYTLLTDDLKNLMFPTEESFSNYMTLYLNDKMYSPSFSKYTKLNKEDKIIYIVKINYLPYSTEETDILTPSYEMSDTFAIYIIDENNYKFSFTSFIGTETSESKFENDDFSCNIIATHLYTTKTRFDIELTNKSDSTMFINKDEIYCLTGVLPKYYSSAISIPPNTSTTINYTIYTGLSLKSSLPQRIYFNGIHINNNVHLFNLPIHYPVTLH